MTLIKDTEINQLMEIEVTLTGDAPVTLGQGSFEIRPSSMSIVWARFNGESWILSKVKVRGLRLDNGSTGLRAWYPIDDMPSWVWEIVQETSPRQEV